VSGLPTGAGAMDGWVVGRERGSWVRGGLEEGKEMGREEGPHGVLPEGIRREVRGHRACFGGGSGAGKASQTRQGPHLYGRLGRDCTDDA